MQNTEKNTDVKETTTSEATEAVEEKNTKIEKPQKARTIEELKEVSPINMTRNEAIKYIKYLREECELHNAKIEALTQSADSAFKKAQYCERIATTIAELFDKQNNFFLSSMNNLITSAENASAITALNVQNIIKGGYNNAN